jgi:hypothetical protein
MEVSSTSFFRVPPLWCSTNCKWRGGERCQSYFVSCSCCRAMKSCGAAALLLLAVSVKHGQADQNFTAFNGNATNDTLNETVVPSPTGAPDMMNSETAAVTNDFKGIGIVTCGFIDYTKEGLCQPAGSFFTNFENCSETNVCVDLPKFETDPANTMVMWCSCMEYLDCPASCTFEAFPKGFPSTRPTSTAPWSLEGNWISGGLAIALLLFQSMVADK